MHPEAPHGNVLVLVEDGASGERLGGWIAATGERPVVVRSGERVRSDETVDLVVTDLRLDEAPSRALLERLLGGDLFPAVPRLHLFRNEAERLEIAEGGPDAALQSLAFPQDSAAQFQARARLAAEVGRLRRELVRVATSDAVTGLANRPFLVRRIDEEYARARRHRSQLSVVMFDVDRLASINRTFGYATGDSILERVAEILRLQVRQEDVAGRLQGATFGVVLPANGYRGAATFAHKVRSDTEGIVVQHGDDSYKVHLCAGISTFPDSPLATCGEALLSAAENALAEAKARGGNRVFIDETVLSHERRIVLVADPDPELLDLAEDLLAADEWQIVRADSARAVLETLRFRRPDLLVIDLQMTEHDGGPPLIEQVQSMFPRGDFPIIGMSSDPRTTSDHLSRLGIDRFITKPFSVSLLRAAARELIEATRTS